VLCWGINWGQDSSWQGWITYQELATLRDEAGLGEGKLWSWVSVLDSGSSWELY
jgi:hypothetical protein